MEKPIVVLNDWVIVCLDTNPYLPPEARMPALNGCVFGHTRFVDGIRVTTSPIKSRIGDVIETESGTVYALGSVDPDYEKQHPNARERVLNSVT
jgi:hypothetical protein